MNATSVPGVSPNLFLIRAGIVTCPLLEIFIIPNFRSRRTPRRIFFIDRARSVRKDNPMRILTISLLVLLSFASLHAESFYTTDATFTPGPEPDTYHVKFIIKKITVHRGTEKEELVAAPAVTSKLGQPASIEILGGRKSKDITVSTFYPSKDSAAPLTCSVEIKEKGKITYRTTLSAGGLHP